MMHADESVITRFPSRSSRAFRNVQPVAHRAPQLSPGLRAGPFGQAIRIVGPGGPAQVRPPHVGGSNCAENLITLCSGCHQALHRVPVQPAAGPEDVVRDGMAGQAKRWMTG